MSWYCLVLRSSEEQIRNKASSKIARRLWKQAGHKVTTLGREGGDASDADVVFVAVPSGSISEALGKVSGLEGKIAIDACSRTSARCSTALPLPASSRH